MAVSPGRFFAAEEVARARRYHRPLYRALVLEVAIGLGLLLLCSHPTPPERLAAAS